jgi:hypothetical protein
MSAWTDVSEVIINKWAIFTRAETNIGLRHPVTISLEEINKRWDRPSNWAVTISEHDGNVLMHERFYLNVESFSAENAQKRADELVAEHWNPKPVVAPQQFMSGNEQALLLVQEKNYGSGMKSVASPAPVHEIVVDTEDAFIKHLASKVQVAE